MLFKRTGMAGAIGTVVEVTVAAMAAVGTEAA